MVHRRVQTPNHSRHSLAAEGIQGRVEVMCFCHPCSSVLLGRKVVAAAVGRFMMVRLRKRKTEPCRQNLEEMMLSVAGEKSGSDDKRRSRGRCTWELVATASASWYGRSPVLEGRRYRWRSISLDMENSVVGDEK